MVKILVIVMMVTSILFGCNSKQSEEINKDADDKIDINEPGDGEYRNPVFMPVLADPTIVKADDGYFYAYGTEDDWANGDVHFVPIVRSQNLVHWEFVSDAFSTKPSWKNQGFIWAPDVTLIDGKYYMYYSYSLWGDPNPGIGLAISNKPEGPFVDYGKIFLSKDIGVDNSIDPFYIENEGTKLLFWGSFRGIYGIELSADGKTIVGNKFKIAGDFMEATYIHKKDGYYYLFGSIGSCCDGAKSTYKVVVGRSENIKGPYLGKDGSSFLEKSGPIFLEENTTGGFVGPGHNAEIVTDDEGIEWFLYHAIDRNFPKLPAGASKRPLMLDKISWENGWPVIKNNQPGTGIQQAPVFK